MEHNTPLWESDNSPTSIPSLMKNTHKPTLPLRNSEKHALVACSSPFLKSSLLCYTSIFISHSSKGLHTTLLQCFPTMLIIRLAHNAPVMLLQLSFPQRLAHICSCTHMVSFPYSLKGLPTMLLYC